MKFDGANHVGGRPPGAKNKLQRDFLEALAKDFADHGEAAIKIVRIEQPDVYLKVVASLMPKELEVEHSQLGDMSDDEVNALLEYVQIERAKLIEHKPRMIEAPGKAPAIADKSVRRLTDAQPPWRRTRGRVMASDIDADKLAAFEALLRKDLERRSAEKFAKGECVVIGVSGEEAMPHNAAVIITGVPRAGRDDD